jgi:DNA-formamidopyrimidine glycosylase
MPEGPEIVITTQYLTTKIKKKKIKSIEVVSGRYTHETLKGLKLTKNTPLTIKSIDSKGKFMWMEFVDNDGKTIYMLNTFGLTGHWSFHEEANSRVKFVIESATDSSKTYTLYFIDQRNFGTMEFTDNEQLLKTKLKKLAPDVLKTTMTDDDLVEMIKNYNAKTKKDKNLVKVLMDQNAIVSGIGNYLVAEILYDAKLNPHRSLDSLSNSEIETLAHSIRKIVKYAYYDNDTGYMDHFKDFMKTHAARIDKGIFPNYHPDIKANEGFKFKVYLKDKDPHGNNVEKDRILKDRTIHWVKNIQK